jgi:hypothetical protein
MANDQFDYEPVPQSGPDGTEETKYQNRDPVRVAAGEPEEAINAGIAMPDKGASE